MNSRPLRLRVLAGAAVCAMLAGAAHGQAFEGPINIEADALTTKDGRIDASGNVRAVGNGQTLAADRMVSLPGGELQASGNVAATAENAALAADQVTYNRQTGVVSATGDIRIFPDNGSVLYADTLIATDDLVTGVATGFAARAPGDVSFAAANVIMRDETHMEMNRAIFTACPLCDADGNEKDPTWSVSADKMVVDEESHSVNYRNAIIRLGPVPVLYLPFFSHADFTVDRKTGLLAPNFGHTERRGISYDQPFLWSISPYSDLILAPQFNTEVNPFLNIDYRKRFYSGDLNVLGGYTHEQDFDAEGATFGNSLSKAYILADGAFEISPAWDWGFTADRARDRRLFDQYSIEYMQDDRGLFLADDRRLISQIYTVRQDDQSYLSVAALAFQSLRPLSGVITPSGLSPLEDDNTLPAVGPLVEFRYTPTQTFAGGRVKILASGVALSRDLSPTFTGAPGVDSSRATFEAEWRRTFTLTNGLRLEPFGSLRGDYYSTRDLGPGDTETHQNSRGLATAGLDISWPMARIDGPVTTTIEPILQIALSPEGKANAQIPNEDSAALQFDETNLFEVDRFPGFDLYESGQRITAGVRTTIDWGDGRSARFVVGQSFRAESDPSFLPQTGLDGTASDWIAAVEVTPIVGLSMFARTRFDDFDLQRIEAGVDATLDRGSGYLRYMRTVADYQGVAREDIEGAAEVLLTDNWGVVGSATRDLEQQEWLRRSAGLFYEDDCLRFELLYQRDNNPVLGSRESSSFVVRLTLATLGEDGKKTPYGAGRTRPRR